MYCISVYVCFYHYLAFFPFQNPSLESGITVRRRGSGATSRSSVSSSSCSSSAARKRAPPPLEKRVSSSSTTSTSRQQRIQTDNGTTRDSRNRGKKQNTAIPGLGKVVDTRLCEPAPAASQEAGFTQPRDYSFAQPCT